jgi:hypothetical protein
MGVAGFGNNSPIRISKSYATFGRSGHRAPRSWDGLYCASQQNRNAMSPAGHERLTWISRRDPSIFLRMRKCSRGADTQAASAASVKSRRDG